MEEELFADLFVYGTLLSGDRSHGLLLTAQFLGEDALAGVQLYDAGDYPYLRLEGNGTVYGERYRVSPETLARLDAFEECPQVYSRIWVTLVSGNQSWVYEGRAQYVQGLPAIASGRWRERFLPDNP
jgi:gamma-glutamylcyclotransferase (GGCT)/AIG2-like uncharacterized protein YtfP